MYRPSTLIPINKDFSSTDPKDPNRLVLTDMYQLPATTRLPKKKPARPPKGLLRRLKFLVVGKQNDTCLPNVLKDHSRALWWRNQCSAVGLALFPVLRGSGFSCALRPGLRSP